MSTFRQFSSIICLSLNRNGCKTSETWNDDCQLWNFAIFFSSHLSSVLGHLFFLVGSLSLLMMKKKKRWSMLQCGQCITVASTTFTARQASEIWKMVPSKAVLMRPLCFKTIAELSCRLRDALRIGKVLHKCAVHMPVHSALACYIWYRDPDIICSITDSLACYVAPWIVNTHSALLFSFSGGIFSLA